jgi:SAM-dependent methyltransferase
VIGLVERIHGAYVYPRRVARLSEELARLVPRDARVLDIGSGDGALAGALLERRPDLGLEGVDVVKRAHTAIPTREFDGKRLPHADDAFDVALLVDVVHHVDEPLELLREAARVARAAIVIKDHLDEGALAEQTLRLMDRVGNARYGVALPYSYWPRARWHEVIAELGLEVLEWNERLRIYPWPASLVFDRSLHFMARLEPPGTATTPRVALLESDRR